MRNDFIDNGSPFDWGKTSEDYAKYRDIYPEAFYDKLAELSIGVKGQTVLDLGTGTGVLPRNMYRYGADWTGADISENQIAYARKLTEEAGMDIRYIVSPAEAVDFPDGTFDVITACQCFMYFDKAVLLPKIYKMLKPNGHFCVLFMAWLPEESPIAKASEELVLKYNPSWTGGHMTRYTLETPEWCGDMFEPANMLTCDLAVHFTRESWHGRIKACRGIGASSLGETERELWEQEHKAFLQTVPESFDILHYVSILDLKKK
ncbi:MAG: methyltransferase domain-containing protein [Oscillospiraceae bacterium]|nr:methyltransferase domain-containing protein [Oscillospiraceae bacterium]